MTSSLLDSPDFLVIASHRYLAAKQSYEPNIGLLRREEHPPRNDGDADILVVMFFAK